MGPNANTSLCSKLSKSELYNCACSNESSGPWPEREPVSSWNILPDQWDSDCLGPWDTPESKLKIWFMVVSVAHAVQTWLLEGLETKVNHTRSQACLPDQNPVNVLGQPVSGKLPWLAIFYVCYYAPSWGEISALCSGRRQLKVVPGLPWTLSCVAFPISDFNLYPFTVINYKCEYHIFAGFHEPF